jgi:aminoglycoside phosphotransferase (APT) family kinase protein
VSDVSTPREVRAEDAFDVDAVATWLRANAVDSAGLDGEPAVRQFAGGASNLTYQLAYPSGREVILRRPPVGTKAKGAHDMAREFRIQQALKPVYPLVPTMLGHCADESVIGSEFYVMDKLDGLILRKDVPRGVGLDGPAQVDRLCDNAVQALVDLHGVDLAASALDSLDRGPGYVERQVGGWIERYQRARTEDVGDFAETIAWLAAHQPVEQPHTMIHNDFRFDNLVLDHADPTRIVGVLDWELATVGDPLMDVGSAMAYWAQAEDPQDILNIRLQPTNAPGMWTREQVWTAYADRRGVTVSESDRRFYELFGTFRLAGIAQQIYYRFFHGQTTNPAAGFMGIVVHVLDARCKDLLA